MSIREYLFKQGIKSVLVARETKIDSAKLSKFLNGWAKLTDVQVLQLSKFLKVTVEEIKSNKIICNNKTNSTKIKPTTANRNSIN